MSRCDYTKLRSIVEKETRKHRKEYSKKFESMDKRMGWMQYQIDCLYGADPEELQTEERNQWKKSITARCKIIREHHPDESVKTDYRVIFGRLYDSLQREYKIDLNAEKIAYMERHGISRTAYRNVRTLNIVYDNTEIRCYFEKTVEKFEGWFVKN